MTMLELQVRTQNAVSDAVTDLVRRTRDEKGQTSVEYLGVILVVVTLIIAFKGAIGPVASDLVSAIQTQIGKLV